MVVEAGDGGGVACQRDYPFVGLQVEEVDVVVLRACEQTLRVWTQGNISDSSGVIFKPGVLEGAVVDDVHDAVIVSSHTDGSVLREGESLDESVRLDEFFGASVL